MTTTGIKGTKSRRGLSRRALLKATAGTAALLGALQAKFPGGAHIAQAAGPEVKKANLGFIALTDAAPLFVAKEKGIFAKYGMPDVEVQKQASWGATRDNLVLGSEGNGIDGAHILTPDALPHLRRQGDAEQCADADVHPGAAQPGQPVHLGRQGVCGAADRARHQAVQGSARQEEGRGQVREGRDDFSRRHPRPLDPLLARCRRHRPRQGHRDHRGAAAANGGEHEGRHHGLLLRVRAVEPAAHPPEHRLHRDHDRRAMEQASGKVARAARRLCRQISERREGAADGDDGSADVVREDGEPRGSGRHLRQAPMDQLPGRGRDRSHEGRNSITASRARWSRTARTS